VSIGALANRRSPRRGGVFRTALVLGWQMLKTQLHAHFLFNTLNGNTGLVRDNDNAAAVQMPVGPSDLSSGLSAEGFNAL
jgi:hypothetical protein